MTISFGTNPIAWSNDDLPELGGETSLETCLSQARQAGFTGIEKGNKFPADPGALLDVLGHHGLTFISGWYGAELRHRDVEDELAAMRPHLDLLKACGCQVMVLAETSGTVQGRMDVPVADRPVMTAEEWPVFLGRLGHLGRHMADEGVRIAFHHHMGTVIETAPEITRLLEGTPDEVGLLFDTGHLAFAGEDPVALARIFTSRVNHIHAKDIRADVLARAKDRRWSFLKSVLEGVYTVPGDGSIGFAEVLKPFAAGGYDGWLVVEAEQDPAKAHPLTYARAGFHHLHAAAQQAGFVVT